MPKKSRSSLPEGCYIGTMSVHPKNWNTRKADPNSAWYITYYFTDPAHRDRYPYGYKVTVKGMNRETNLAEKQALTRQLMAVELQQLQRGYNPITKQFAEPKASTSPVQTTTPLVDALEFAYQKHQSGDKAALKSMLRYVKQAAVKLGIDMIPISEITRARIKMLLDQVGSVKKSKWTANNQNFYRSHLSMLFALLEEWEAIDYNPVTKIKKKTHVRATRRTPTTTERQTLIERLQVDNYPFYRFVRIFHRSGARRTEIMLVRKEDVQLNKQEVAYTVNKGGTRTVYRVIPDDVLPFWQEVYMLAAPGQYLFSRGLVPGDKPIRPEQVTRRWKKFCKEKYGIEADLYSLKHLNTTTTAAKVGIELAAQHNAHAADIAASVYDVDGVERKNELLKRIKNEL
ncbi:MAG: hypothetical protein EBX40_00480 [Gammaproteobacteria bacterium]|nr:hypothetical protein [Gammaproteobacteria bacterium]